MKQYVMVIDEGTTGTRSIIFNRNFQIVGQSYMSFTQYTPDGDRVEHDALEIYDKSVQNCRNAMKEAGIEANEVECLGITNQRGTTVVWDKETGIPLHRAIVWQDCRTGQRCAELNDSPWGEKCKQTTGWVIAPVYSSLMLEWLLKNRPEVADAVASGRACFGTIDSWLIWKLTGGKTHAVSYSNASVTGSLNIHTGEWYREFLEYLGVPVSIYPQIKEDSADYGYTEEHLFGAPIPITSSIADQHAALYAQNCNREGTAKLTNGTGSFLDVNIGETCQVLPGGINTVIAWKLNGKIQYAMEGYAAVTGSAVHWLRDELGIIHSSQESEDLARTVSDSNGVFFVPALTGLGAPYWDSFARGMIIGISRGVNKAHICRATLEAVGYSVADIMFAIEKGTGKRITDVYIDGGASKNNLVAQHLADILGATIYRPMSIEATSLGAAKLAGLYAGVWKEEDFSKSVEIDKVFTPSVDERRRKEQYFHWQDAVARCSGWLNHNYRNKDG